VAGTIQEVLQMASSVHGISSSSTGTLIALEILPAFIP